MVQAAIVTKWKFVPTSNKKFQKYIDYIDREEAVRNRNFNQYNLISSDGYNHYMENPEKSSGLFTQNKNHLTTDERKEVKKLFEVAQKNESIMWQDVVSFDTKWLMEAGLYDPVDGYLNESKIMNAVRVAMKEQLKNENLLNSALWTGAIHYNELHHIHVHIAIVEPEPTREFKTFTDSNDQPYQARRGFRSKKNVDRFKSQVMSQLLDRDEPLARISSLIRSQLGQHKGQMKRLPDNDLRYLYGEIYKELPHDRRQWKYNMNALNDIRPMIDRFTRTYLANYEQAGYQELQALLDENVDFYMKIYGEGTKEYQRAKDFKTNKNQELFATMGNSLLKEMLEESKQLQPTKMKSGSMEWSDIMKGGYQKSSPEVNLSKIKKALSKDFQSLKNQQVYLRNIRSQEEGWSR